jgi:rSAM/selenodomain-associated transferase 1
MARAPAAGAVKTRLVPPLSPDGARDLYMAFLHDTAARFRRTKLRPEVFLSGDRTPDFDAWLPRGWPVRPQRGTTLGERLSAAFDALLDRPGARAVVVGSDSPDLPLIHIKRAFRLLKHRDVVLGPALDGGYYLVGLRAPAPELFVDIAWGTASVLADTVRAAEASGRSLALTPPWYDVDDAASLALLDALCRARRLAGGERLVHTERFLAAHRGAGRAGA